MMERCEDPGTRLRPLARFRHRGPLGDPLGQVRPRREPPRFGPSTSALTTPPSPRHQINRQEFPESSGDLDLARARFEALRTTTA